MGYRPFVCTALLALPAIAAAAELSADTLAAWNQYVAAADLQMKARLDGKRPFLNVDEEPNLAPRLRQSEIIVTPGEDRSSIRVPGGLIHHWTAAAFFPGSSVPAVIAALRDYDRYSKFYGPSVVESKSLGETGDDDLFSMRVINKAVLSKIALDADFKSSYFLNGNRAYKTMATTRVQQIEEYGQSGQHMLPSDEGSGLVWRLYSIARFEERDGGVYFEIDAMALSREIPASIQWMAGPMIRRIAKGSLSGMLEKTREAVLNSVEVAHHASPAIDCGRAIHCLVNTSAR
jgi:hypothetical protein